MAELAAISEGYEYQHNATKNRKSNIRGRIDIEASWRYMAALTQKVYFFLEIAICQTLAVKISPKFID